MPVKQRTGQDNALRVGIDLGTSRSAVASSDGDRNLVESYVGWPKDFVARKMLGERVLFGERALEHRLSLTLVRPLEGGVIKEGTDLDEDSVRELIGHLVDLAGSRSDRKVHAAVGVPAEALKINRLAIKDAVSQYADKLIIVSEPFSVAYGLRTLDNAMVIDIGAGTVDFCIMHGTMPREADQRSLLTAGDYVDRRLFELLKESHPEADFTINMVRRLKEEHGFVGNSRKKVTVELPVQGKLTTYDITAEMAQACESIVPAIAEAAMELIGNFDPEFQERVRANIILAGGGSQIAGIADHIGDAIKEWAPCKITAVHDPLYAGADGALALVDDMPEEYWGKI